MADFVRLIDLWGAKRPGKANELRAVDAPVGPGSLFGGTLLGPRFVQAPRTNRRTASFAPPGRRVVR